MMNERSENMREIDTLRNVDMAQRKAEARHASMLAGMRRIMDLKPISADED